MGTEAPACASISAMLCFAYRHRWPWFEYIVWEMWDLRLGLCTVLWLGLFQTGNTDVQVATRLRAVVSLRRMQVGAWGQSPSPLVWRHHMCHTVVQNSSGGQVVWCRWTAALEQVALFTAVIWQSRPGQKTVEDVFVCQELGCCAWLLLVGVGYKYSYLLTYLLTYLLSYLLLHCSEDCEGSRITNFRIHASCIICIRNNTNKKS